MVRLARELATISVRPKYGGAAVLRCTKRACVVRRKSLPGEAARADSRCALAILVYGRERKAGIGIVVEARTNRIVRANDRARAERQIRRPGDSRRAAGNSVKPCISTTWQRFGCRPGKRWGFVFVPVVNPQ